jgi:hypothetical protein
MKYLLMIIGMTIFSCSSSKKIIERGKDGKYLYSSGNLSGIDYIMVTKKTKSTKIYQIVIDCNHYINEIGKTILLKKTIFSGKEYSTFHFIKDTSMLSVLNYNYANNSVKLSIEEYEVIKTSFIKYPTLTVKYSLNADSLRNYLGWLEIKK